MLFVTGTDTGVGKTHTATVLLQQMQRLGFQAGAYKPVCSGAETETSPADGQTPRYFWSDVRRLQQASPCQPPAPSSAPNSSSHRWPPMSLPPPKVGLSMMTCSHTDLTSGKIALNSC